MKKLWFSTFLLIITLSASATAISFLEDPTWETVLQRAKKEKKLIFLDGYATWCGPCKQMDAQTYKDQAVADYYNANFINVKYDMEKGVGKELAEKYLVTAYPSLIFIDENGVMLHKAMGFHEADEFVSLGKTAKDPNTQYYILKKKALTLNSAQFLQFAEAASAMDDEDMDTIFDQYLLKQPDILADENLIALIMQHVSSLPNEKMLGYLKANKAKVVQSGKFTAEDFDQRLVGLTLGYAMSGSIQTDQENIDFKAVDRILNEYVPEKAFYAGNFVKTQVLLEAKKVDEALENFYLLLDNTPSKISYSQLCNAMMAMAPVFSDEGKLEPLMKKFEAVPVPATETEYAYMKDFIKAYIAIKGKDFEQFKKLANAMLERKDVPEKVKEDLKTALGQVNK